MFNSKYSNILTMFLVILIVAILGIVGYFAYSFLNSKSINNNASSVVDEFKKAKETIKRDTSNIKKNTVEEQNVVEQNVINPEDIANALGADNTNTVEETPAEEVPEEKVMMEDYEVMGTIRIPKTGIEYPILETVTKRSIEIAVGIAYGPGLNEVGNTIIFGHNYRNGLFFSNNKKLVNGDKIYITDKSGETVTYEVYKVYETTASDASYMQRDTEGRREISLQTCTDDSSGRIIVWAKEVV